MFMRAVADTTLASSGWCAVVRVPDGWPHAPRTPLTAGSDSTALPVINFALQLRASRMDHGQAQMMRALFAQQHHAVLVLEAFMAAHDLPVSRVCVAGVAREVVSSYCHTVEDRPVIGTLLDQLTSGAIQHVVSCSPSR